MNERRGPQVKRTWLTAFEDLIDRCISMAAPASGAARMATRRRWRAAEARMTTYEGAASDHTRGSSWLASRLSADSALEGDLETLRNRSRELYRNDSIGGAVDNRTNLVVSYGFTPQARIKERAGIATAEQAEQWNGELEDLFQQIAPTLCKTGRRSLYQLARLAERHHGFDGESVTILSAREDGKPIPLVVEVVDPERLATPPGKLGNRLVRLGVEYDESGRIVAYWIRDSHPYDTLHISEKFTRYPAERVLHVFEAHFAGQSRGLPWLVRALNRAKDAKDLDEAAILAAQVEACFAAFVTSDFGANRAAEGAAAETVDSRRIEDIRPGTIRYLDRGEEVNFGNPSRPGNNFAPFQEWNYRRAAAGMNFPYEMLVKNWGGLSFAAGRLALAEGRLFVQAQQQLLTEAWLSKIWARMVFEGVLFGAVSIDPIAYQRYTWWFNCHSWTPPAWPFALTPGEEIEANIKAVNNNLKTKSKVVGEFGGDWEDVAAQRRDERALEREYEIEPATADEVPQDSLQQRELENESTAA